jgi:hypothetical protein
MLGSDTCARPITQDICSIDSARRLARLAGVHSWQVFVEHEVAVCVNLHAEIVFKQPLRFILLKHATTDARACSRVSADRICITSADRSTNEGAR